MNATTSKPQAQLTANYQATKPAPRSPQAIKSELDASELVERCKGHETALANVRTDALLEAGLCERCKGDGGWDYLPTLDYMHDWAYQQCPECDGVNRAKSIIEALDYPPEHQADFERLHVLQTEWTRSDKLADGEWIPARTNLYGADTSSRAQELKGMLCVVYRGRKVKPGIVGVCFWVGQSQWGERVGLRVEGQTEPVWVDAKNVRPVWADEQAK